MKDLHRRGFLRLTGAVSAGAAGAFAESRQNDRNAPSVEAFSWSSPGLRFSFDVFENRLRQKYLLPSEAAHNFPEPAVLRTDNWSLEIAMQCTGEDCADHHGMKFEGGMPGGRLIFSEKKEASISNGSRLVLISRDPVLDLKVESFYDAFDELPVVRRYTRVTNLGSRPVGLEYVSSAMLSNVGSPQSFENELRIHIPFNSWQAEGQWRAFRPSELGFVQNGEFSLSGVFASVLGTWSTERYLPMALVENTALGLTWFWQIEHNGSWHWELSNTSAKTLYAYLGGPDEQHSHAWKNLEPGSSYQTVPAALGCVHGGFTQAIEALTLYRRRICVRAREDGNRSCPVIFNDGASFDLDPNTQNELPLIDAAAEAGCEYYVIDAGWYAEAGQNWWGSVGVWEAPRSRWPGGLELVLAKIRQKGMIPGLWLEPEVIGIHSPLKNKPDDWFFLRHGLRVIDHDRYLLDFRNPAVRGYLDGVLNRLVEHYGIGYLKLDYNVDGLEGTEWRADSPGQGLLEHNRALLAWLEKILTRYPHLVIENCASGGGRVDYAMLSRLQLESASDQGDYRKYPAITTGSSAGVLPEQLGIWCLPSNDTDPDQATFNMVNAMLCRIHLSGALLSLKPASLAQIKAGIRVYKDTLRRHIAESVPFYPFGMPDMTDSESPVALGMRSRNANFIAVWRLEGPEQVHLPTLRGNFRLIYPPDLGITVDASARGLLVTFPRKNMACIVSVEESAQA